jgi:hypothetical protein
MIINLRELFDYKDSNGNVMQYWATQMCMQKRDRGRLDSRIDILRRVGDNLPPRLLHPTRCKHIMHLVVNGEVALRPMLCLGPFDHDREFTFLFGTIERDRKLVQRDAPERAEQNRNDLIIHPENRCKHERFAKGI